MVLYIFKFGFHILPMFIFNRLNCYERKYIRITVDFFSLPHFCLLFLSFARILNALLLNIRQFYCIYLCVIIHSIFCIAYTFSLVTTGLRNRLRFYIFDSLLFLISKTCFYFFSFFFLFLIHWTKSNWLCCIRNNITPLKYIGESILDFQQHRIEHWSEKYRVEQW